LMYFIDEDRINQFEGDIQPPNWLELSEKWCARTTPKLAAAERIEPILVTACAIFNLSRCLFRALSTVTDDFGGTIIMATVW
jgi:hypothetical protein